MAEDATLFENLRFQYIGPINGHDMPQLLSVLRAARTRATGPVLIHCCTTKGKGYAPAEESDCRYHGVSKFDPATGKRLRDAGFYTLIPMVMVAGPLLGYFVGLFLEKKFGGEPWPVTCGVLIGLAAGFRQVFLMLVDKTNPPPPGK